MKKEERAKKQTMMEHKKTKSKEAREMSEVMVIGKRERG